MIVFSPLQGTIQYSIKNRCIYLFIHYFTSFKNDIVVDVRQLVKEEISSALKEHGASINNKLNSYLRSGAGTPVSFTDEEDNLKERILRELKSSRINEAFQIVRLMEV